MGQKIFSMKPLSMMVISKKLIRSLDPRVPIYGPWKILGKNTLITIFACQRFFSFSVFVIQNFLIATTFVQNAFEKSKAADNFSNQFLIFLVDHKGYMFWTSSFPSLKMYIYFCNIFVELINLMNFIEIEDKPNF